MLFLLLLLFSAVCKDGLSDLYMYIAKSNTACYGIPRTVANFTRISSNTGKPNAVSFADHSSVIFLVYKGGAFVHGTKARYDVINRQA